MNTIWQVFKKEILDAWRDRGVLWMTLLSALLTGPLILFLMSFVASDIEDRADKREIHVVGIEHAPSLRNYLERQAYEIAEPASDFEVALKSGHWRQPVLMIGSGHEVEQQAGQFPVVRVMTASGTSEVNMLTRRLLDLLEGFNQEQTLLKFISHGVSADSLGAIEVQEVDLMSPAQGAAGLMGFIPFMLLSAVMYGCLASALDCTAGERERQSLEPLLCTPVSAARLMIGKWLCVTLIGAIVCALVSFGLLWGQSLLRSEALASMFRFSWIESLQMISIMLPLACLSAAVMMAIGLRSVSHKQAQTQASIFMALFSLLPLFIMLNQKGEQAWHLLPPVLAQFTLMTRVLRGESVLLSDHLQAAMICLGLSMLLIGWMGRQLRSLAGR